MESFMEQLPLVLAVLFALSEGLAMIPALQSNSVFQLVRNLLKKAKEMFPKKPELPKMEEEKKDDK